MSHRNFEKTDSTENIENVEKTDKTEGKEKESILSRAKDFFAEYGKNKEGKEENADKKEESTDKDKETREKKAESGEGQQGRKSWELSPEEKEKVNKSAKEMADQYKSEHKLDDHGNSIDPNAKRPEGGYERERGDDDPRSRWEDSEDEKNTENTESKKKETTAAENN